MNIYQRKINKQAELFKDYHNTFWRKEDMTFRQARTFVKYSNRDEMKRILKYEGVKIDHIEHINNEIEMTKIAKIELLEERKNEGVESE